MITHYYGITCNHDQFENEMDDELLLEQARELQESIIEATEWSFYTIEAIREEDPRFQSASIKYLEKYQQYIVRLIAVNILEPGIDYHDTTTNHEFKNKTLNNSKTTSKYYH